MIAILELNEFLLCDEMPKFQNYNLQVGKFL